MNTLYLTLDASKNSRTILPNIDSTPESASEKLVREEIKELTENAEKLKKLKKQVESGTLHKD